MATSLQFTLSNPTPGMEEEFNTWYEEHHLVRGVLTPGVLAGQRFRRAAAPWPSGNHEYLTIWEFDDPAYALEQLCSVKNTEAMPISPSIDLATIQPPTMWLRASVRSAARVATDTAHRQALIVMLAKPREGEEAKFETAMLSNHLAAIADKAGVISADFLTLADQQIRGNARKYPYAVLIEAHDADLAVKALKDVIPALPHLDPERWLAPLFQPIGKRLTTAEAAAR